MAAEHFDAIVVGSGATGGWAAKELTEAGLRVLLLDAGRSIQPQLDYPLPAPGERRMWTRLVHGLRSQPVQMRCGAFNARTQPFFVDDRENPYTTAAGKPFNWFRGRQVGGRLHTWARVVFRLSDLELNAASRDGYGADWPLYYDELAPCYDRVESFLGVCGSADGIAAVPDGIYAGPRVLTPEEERFKAAVESAFADRRVIAACVAQHDPNRIPAAIRAAQRTGRLVLRHDAVVSHVTVDPSSGRATGIAFVDRITKTRDEGRAGVVVLCAGAIESLRILLNSTDSRHRVRTAPFAAATRSREESAEVRPGICWRTARCWRDPRTGSASIATDAMRGAFPRRASSAPGRPTRSP